MQDFRDRLYIILNQNDTLAGRLFDYTIFSAIMLSITAVMLESVPDIRRDYGDLLVIVEWIFTIFFSIEYILRIMAEKERGRYIFSFFGIIDYLAIVPTYLAVIFPPAHYLLDIRIFRLLRIFRIFKLVRYVKESRMLIDTLKAARPKIIIFFVVVITITVIVGTLLYMLEDEASGFTSIPRSVYWAIVTITTVGYGDIAPETIMGQILASVMMILGYAIIAIPTGIFGAELIKANGLKTKDVPCTKCGFTPHETRARHCQLCGTVLPIIPE